MESFFEQYLDSLTQVHQAIEATVEGLPLQAIDWIPGPEHELHGSPDWPMSPAQRSTGWETSSPVSLRDVTGKPSSAPGGGILPP